MLHSDSVDAGVCLCCRWCGGQEHVCYRVWWRITSALTCVERESLTRACTVITSSTTSKHCLFPAPDISSASGVYLKCTKVTSETGLSCSAVCCSALSLLDVEQSCKQMAAGEIPIIKLEVTVQDLKEIFQVSFSSCFWSSFAHVWLFLWFIFPWDYLLV